MESGNSQPIFEIFDPKYPAIQINTRVIRAYSPSLEISSIILKLYFEGITVRGPDLEKMVWALKDFQKDNVSINPIL